MFISIDTTLNKPILLVTKNIPEKKKKAQNSTF
jgi:hypothetical protein